MDKFYYPLVLHKFVLRGIMVYIRKREIQHLEHFYNSDELNLFIRISYILNCTCATSLF